MKTRPEVFMPYLLLVLLFGAALAFRPLLPVDETRYLTVAWEMFLQKQYAVMSLNFQPYHHKPPMLFWLVNVAWEIFGVSRWAAMIPVFGASAVVLFFTGKLAERVYPAQKNASVLAPWLMMGSVPFLIYSTLVMFDVMVMALLLAALVTLWDYAREPRPYRILVAGLLIGAGVLTKGPVMLLYILWPLALYAFWKPDNFISGRKFCKAVLLALAISLLPVALWLVPALGRTDQDFAFWLVWNQTAGRISGNFNSAHARPVFFYLFLLPALFLPWVFLPAFWRNARKISSDRGFRFLAAATVPAFISFSLISGKQPHYLLPLLPFIIIGVTVTLASVQTKTIKGIVISMVALIIAGQGAASRTSFPRYDLTKFAEFYQNHREADWAFVRNYQGELGFLAQVEKPIESLSWEQLPQWFEKHPEGLAIVRYGSSDDLSGYEELYSSPYKGKRLGIFKKAGAIVPGSE